MGSGRVGNMIQWFFRFSDCEISWDSENGQSYEESPFIDHNGSYFLVRAHGKIFFISIRRDHLKSYPLEWFLSPMPNNLECFICLYTGLIFHLLNIFYALLTWWDGYDLILSFQHAFENTGYELHALHICPATLVL